MKQTAGAKCLSAVIIVGFLVALAGFRSVARADWNPGDPYKMHYPQLPDPLGWDVNFTQPKVLADDWLCTETGPVSDVHLWFSSHQDMPFNLFSVHLSIHADIPAGSGGAPYSMPGQELWAADIPAPSFSIRPWGTGNQGWYDPPGIAMPGDHFQVWQLNIQNIPNPFIQQQDHIYWLDVSVLSDAMLGWKTSLQHFNDDAVWNYLPPAGPWQELRDPFTGQSLDLAFVITVPEPQTVALVGISIAGLLTVIRRKKA